MTETLTIDELAAEAGVPIRTVRYYIAEGLLPGPGGRGRAAAYRDEHRQRLRLIRRLVEQHLPLSEVRQRLAGLDPGDVAALLRDAERRAVERERASTGVSPKAYIAALLREGANHPASAAGATRLSRPKPARLGAPPSAPEGEPRGAPPLSPAGVPFGAPLPAPTEEAPGAPASTTSRAAFGPPSTATRRAAFGPPRRGPNDATAWSRHELAPGVELHVRADAEIAEQDLVRRLHEAARKGPARSRRGTAKENRYE